MNDTKKRVGKLLLAAILVTMAVMTSLPACADTAQENHDMGICRVMPAAMLGGRKAAAFINTMNALVDAGIVQRASFYQGFDLDKDSHVDLSYGAFSTGEIDLGKYRDANIQKWTFEVPPIIVEALETDGKDHFAKFFCDFDRPDTDVMLFLGATSGGSFEYKGQTYRDNINATCSKGETVSLTAKADDGKEFVGWFEGIEAFPDYFVTRNTGLLISEDATYSFPAAQITLLQAVFKDKANASGGGNPPADPGTDPGSKTNPGTETKPETVISDPVPTPDPITIKQAPKSVKVKAKKNKVTVSWKKIKKTKKTKALLKQIKSIQVQYDKNPGFSNPVSKRVGKSKTKVVIKLKKKKTYYFRVRYVGIDGFSKWSKTKKVKTK